MKVSEHQGDIMILNVCAQNNGASEYMHQKVMELKGEWASSVITVGAFHTHLILCKWQNY